MKNFQDISRGIPRRGTHRGPVLAMAVMITAFLLAGNAAWGQAADPWRPYQPEPRDQFQSDWAGSEIAPSIREELRRAGLTQREIQHLQQRNFPLLEVQRVVLNTLLEQGWRHDQARRQADHIAHLIQQQQQQQQRRLHRPYVGRGQLGPGPEGAFRSSGGDLDKIRAQLRLAGLDDRQIEQLRWQGFRYRDVEQEVMRALRERDFNWREAQQIAQQIAEEVHATALVGSPRWGGGPRTEPPGMDARQNTRHRLKMRLREAGLDERQVQQLERQGFEQRQVHRAVMESLREQGWNRQQAQQEAAQIASLAQSLTPGDQDPLSRKDAPWGAERENYDSREVIKHILYQAGLSQDKIRQLEQQDFPRDQVKQAVSEAVRQDLDAFAESITEKVERAREQ